MVSVPLGTVTLSLRTNTEISGRSDSSPETEAHQGGGQEVEEEPYVKNVARIVSAAFALAIIAMPFAQPAAAAGPANIHVEGKTWDYQGIPWGGPGSTPDPNGKVHVTFGIYNRGGSPSGHILVYRYCHYSGGKVTELPAYALPGLTSGKADLVWFDCPRLAGHGLPTKAHVYAFGMNEPFQMRGDYNTDELVFQGLVG